MKLLAIAPAMTPLMEGAVLSALLAALSWCDWKRMILPDGLIILLAALGLGRSWLGGHPPLFEAAFGMLLGGGMLLVTAAVYRYLRGIDGLGMGDVKLGAAAGLWIGAAPIPTVMLIACLSAILFVIGCRLMSRPMGWQSRIPFGPFLCIGTIVTWLSVVV